MKTRYADATVHDRTFDDRRRLLGAALTHLEMHAQRHGKPDLLEKVFEILGAAGTEFLADSFERAKMLNSSQHLKADRKRTQAILNKLGNYEDHLTYMSNDPLLPLVRELRARIQATLLPPTFTGLEGRPNLSAITTRVRARLLDAGVPRSLPWFAMMKQRAGCKANVKNLHESLLMAVGLIPYRRK